MDRRDVHNLAGALGPEQRRHRPDHVERACEVHRDDFAPRLVRQPPQRRRSVDPGRVD